MDSPTHLRSLQALELALRTGSLKGAAERLAITPAAAGQRVKALEDYLGIALLVRGRSGLQATPALAAALPHMEAAFRELSVATGLLDLQRGQDFHIAASRILRTSGSDTGFRTSSHRIPISGSA